jgi:hypothetical protein
MGDSAHMPQLAEGRTAFRMDSGRDRFPCFDLGFAPDPRHSSITHPHRIDRDRFGEDESSRRSLPIVLCHQVRSRQVIFRSSRPGKRGHEDAVRQAEIAYFYWSEKCCHDAFNEATVRIVVSNTRKS